MATLSLAGKNGAVTGVTGVTEVSEWNATLVADPLDATSFASDGWREFIIGLKSGTGSLTAKGKTIPVQGEEVSLELDCGGAGAPQISGDGILVSVGVAVPVDDLVEFTADFNFTGEITTGVVS